MGREAVLSGTNFGVKLRLVTIKTDIKRVSIQVCGQEAGRGHIIEAETNRGQELARLEKQGRAKSKIGWVSNGQAIKG